MMRFAIPVLHIVEGDDPNAAFAKLASELPESVVFASGPFNAPAGDEPEYDLTVVTYKDGRAVELERSRQWAIRNVNGRYYSDERGLWVEDLQAATVFNDAKRADYAALRGVPEDCWTQVL